MPAGHGSGFVPDFEAKPIPVVVVASEEEAIAAAERSARADRRVGYAVMALAGAPVWGLVGRVLYEAAGWGWRLLG